jgi:hypothetical protein
MTARVTTVPEVRHLATIPLYAEDRPNAAGLLGLGRQGAYESARRGELPTIRLGRRVLVPVSKLLALIGVDSGEVE